MRTSHAQGRRRRRQGLAVETACLTYSKLTGVQGLCASGCGSVLEGPTRSCPAAYLAGVGFSRHSCCFIPRWVIQKNEEAASSLTSAMAAASVCLVGLLLFWLNQACVLLRVSDVAMRERSVLLLARKGRERPSSRPAVTAHAGAVCTVAGNVALKEARMMLQTRPSPRPQGDRR